MTAEPQDPGFRRQPRDLDMSDVYADADRMLAEQEEREQEERRDTFKRRDVRRRTDRRAAAVSAARERVRRERQWIDEHGPTVLEYVRRYGSANDDDRHGDGGEAIYAADVAVLRRYEQELRVLQDRVGGES